MSRSVEVIHKDKGAIIVIGPIKSDVKVCKIAKHTRVETRTSDKYTRIILIESSGIIHDIEFSSMSEIYVANSATRLRKVLDKHGLLQGNSQSLPVASPANPAAPSGEGFDL